MAESAVAVAVVLVRKLREAAHGMAANKSAGEELLKLAEALLVYLEKRDKRDARFLTELRETGLFIQLTDSIDAAVDLCQKYSATGAYFNGRVMKFLNHRSDADKFAKAKANLHQVCKLNNKWL